MTLVAQLDVPVGKIDKVSPAFVLRRRKCDVHKRAPLRALRFANQTHLRFPRQTVALARIARDTGANHVLPDGESASVARHDVIEIQVVPLKELAAVLAGVLIALKYIVPRKFHFLFRQPIEEEQHDHTRHPNLPRNRGDDFVIGRGGGKIAPTVEVMREEIVFVVGGNHVGVARVNEPERAPRCADVDRLPEAIQHQNLTV